MRDLKTAVFLVDWVGSRHSFWQAVSNFGGEDLDGKRKCKSNFQKKRTMPLNGFPIIGDSGSREVTSWGFKKA